MFNTTSQGLLITSPHFRATIDRNVTYLNHRLPNVLYTIGNNFVIVDISYKGTNPIFSSQVKRRHVKHAPINFNLVFPFKHVNHQSRVITLQHTNRMFPLTITTTRARHCIYQPNRVRSLRHCNVNPRIMTFFHGQGRSLRAMNHQGLITTTINIFRVSHRNIITTH